MRPRDEKSDSPSRRQDILEQAVGLFLDQGYAGTSMADVARAIGIQKASLYHHFPSKEALFIACVSDGYDGALKRLESIRTDDSLTDAVRIRTAMEEIYRVNLTTPVGRMAPMIAEVAPTIPEVARAFHGGFIAGHYALVTGMIEDGIARGSFAPLDPLGLRQMIFGPVIYLAMEREMTTDFPDRDTLNPVDRIRESHIDLILRLLTSPTADQPAKR
ncbi:MAG: TetR/AcrR family transcriptional regulator [Anaerolineae bacterium]